ncbi:MAG: ABC transporter permease [Pyrinomonadaceae bacterium]|nr:ABC transporter permease [Pyrinomonadaceae bacterium]
MSLSTQDKVVYPTAGGARKWFSSARFSIRETLPPRLDATIGVIGVAVFLLLWCVLSYGGLISPFALPTPTNILSSLAYLYERGELIPPIMRSFWRVIRALFFVIIIGVPIGVLMGAFAPVDAFLRKIINGVKAVPVTGLTALVTLWVGLGESGKILYIFLGAIFYMIILVKNAIAGVSEDYTRVALDVGASRWQIIWRVLLPGALPQIWDAIAVCNGIMWTYIVLAEFLNSNAANLGLGGVLNNGLRLSQPGQVYGMLIVIAIISSLTDFILHIIRRRWFNW